MLSRLSFGALQSPFGKAGSAKLSSSPREKASFAKPTTPKKLIIASTPKTAAAKRVCCASVPALSSGAAAPKPASRGKTHTLGGKSASCKRALGILKKKSPRQPVAASRDSCTRRAAPKGMSNSLP